MAEKKKIMRVYYVKIGRHDQKDENGNLKTYFAGDEVHSDRDLCAMFPNKFSTIPLAMGDQPPAKAVEEKLIVKKNDAKEDNPPATSGEKEVSLGKDVTKDFPEAVKQDYIIYLNDKLLYIVDPEEPKLILNPKGFKKSKEVKPFIAELVKD